MTFSLDVYRADRQQFAVSRAEVEKAIDHLHTPLLEALGVHSKRHVLWDGDLPVYAVMTGPDNNAQWGELMPHWFRPYERPIPLHCLNNWALFAGLFRVAFGLNGRAVHFTATNLVQMIVASDLLIAFLPSTMGNGTFLRHGALTILMGILWLAPDAREAWLGFCEQGARSTRTHTPKFASTAELEQWLRHVEQEAFVAAGGSVVVGEKAIQAFLEDTVRYTNYLRLFQTLALSVTALAHDYGPNWQEWIFQATNVHYRLPGFGLEAILKWLSQENIQ